MSERIPEWLAGELGERELRELREHLAGCPGCADEATALEGLWRALGEGAEVEPPVSLGERLRARLAAEIARERRQVVPIAPRRATSGGSRSLLRFAAAAAVLAAGVFLGSELSERRSTREIAALREDLRAQRETLTMAMLEMRSASDRLRGVAYGRQLSASDDRVASALLDSLLHDPDVNVRLAALDALAPRAGRPAERPRLVAAVAAQSSPLVQLSLLDVLLSSASPAAQRDLEQLLDNPDLDPVVRGYLRDRLGRSL
jgi:hypothetical protein